MRAGHVAALVLTAIIVAAAALPLVAAGPRSLAAEAGAIAVVIVGFAALGRVGADD